MTMIEWVAAVTFSVVALEIAALILLIRRVERDTRHPKPRDPVIEAVYQEALKTLREHRPS
jgi:hypothetical protein